MKKVFRVVIFILLVKATIVENGFSIIADELRKLTCFKFKKKEESAFTPEWKKIGAAEADIYFKALQSSWE